MPSSHRMIRMTAIVSSIVSYLLRASRGACTLLLSNWCATSPSIRRIPPFVVVLLVVASLVGTAEVAAAQDAVQQPVTTSEKSTTAQVAKFLGGAAVALAAHESGHL